MRVALGLGITYLVLTAALIGLVGCARAYDAKECFGIDDCGEGLICFYGSCQDPGYSIDSVSVELTPPAPYLPQQREGLDLKVGFQSVSLVPTLWMTGTVTGGEGGTLVARKQETLAGHDLVRQAPVDPLLGFELAALPGTHALTFIPYAAINGSPGRPPMSFGTKMIEDGADIVLAYPETGFVVRSGRVRYSSLADDPGVPDAYVIGTAEGEQGEFLASSSTITDASGAYTLVFPPGARLFEVTVRPYGNQVVPDVTVAPLELDAVRFDDIVLGVSAFTLGATVLAGDAPVPRAKVFFNGVNVGPHRGTYSAQAEADDLGNVASAWLLPGDYTITVVPGKADPYAMSSRQERLEAARPLSLSVGAKAQVSGTVRDHHGELVSAAQLTWTLRQAPAPREYTVQTDGAGRYAIALDPGEYEVVTQPPADTALARRRDFVQVAGTSGTHSVDLYRPTFVYGRVLDPGGSPLPSVRIAFFSLELSPDSSPVLVGEAVTGLGGEFAVPIPTTDGN